MGSGPPVPPSGSAHVALLCACCCEFFTVLCLFLAVAWVGLWSVIVAFPCQTQLPLKVHSNFKHK